MDIIKTKEKIKGLIDENDNEDLLNEVRRILEFSPTTGYELTADQKSELDNMKQQHEKGELIFQTWDEVKQSLLAKLNR